MKKSALKSEKKNKLNLKDPLQIERCKLFQISSKASN